MPVIIAEIGASHQQSYRKAVELIKAAKCADAVKIQMFTPDDMTLKDRFKVKGGLWDGWDLWELYEKAALPYDWIPALKEFAESLGLIFIATVYHPDTVKIAEGFGIGIYKIASFEIPYIELIEEVAETKKPVLISTGMANYDEIDKALKAVQKIHGNVGLLKCTSSYPAKLEEMNLETIPAMKKAFNVPVGLSDHSKGTIAPIIAVVLGAEFIEKHITSGSGLDDGFALMPDEFGEMVDAIRETEKALGKVTYGGEKKYRREMVEGRMVRQC